MAPQSTPAPPRRPGPPGRRSGQVAPLLILTQVEDPALAGDLPADPFADGLGESLGQRHLGPARQAQALIPGVPLVISIGFKPGELPGAPISKTDGHLSVVPGFTRTGDVIVNDLAAPSDNKVQLTYPRAALESAWSHSHRPAYVMYPPGLSYGAGVMSGASPLTHGPDR